MTDSDINFKGLKEKIVPIHFKINSHTGILQEIP
jgi:hypothetical protein